KALYENNNKTKVAALIDEYDAPVTNYMDDPTLAKANAKILHTFFAALKKPTVSPCVHFTMVTGITRYALTSMDSGPNHLVDISLDPQYAGICGFTLEEFDPLFADRMEATLAGLKNSGKSKPPVNLADLKAEILKWYDGYNWGGPTRVLNPYSILFFFRNKSFDHYWLKSGRPGHLTALIQARPMDFLMPRLEAYLSVEVGKTELTQLQAVPVLFHSGYLTLDKTTSFSSPTINTLTNDTESLPSYTFRVPNFEVYSVYYKDCFAVILQLKSIKDVQTKGNELRDAIVQRNTKIVSSILTDFISPISYYQRPDDEKTFHAYIQLILMTMGFKVISELPGFANRLDLLLELPGRIYVIIELKFSPFSNKKSLTLDEQDGFLANWAKFNLELEARNHALAEVIRSKLPFEDIEEMLAEAPDDILTKSLQDKILAKYANKALTTVERKLALANAVKEKLTKDEIKQILWKAVSGLSLSTDQIEDLLNKAVRKALSDIKEKDYHGIVRYDAKEIIDLGLAIYEGSPIVKAMFGPA
ncbi:MAG: AAA family ATPase, partial [Deltaproteobacteria bacterium]|nr:AAA family ATPase [Deltaproteobacteria bacterium]